MKILLNGYFYANLGDDLFYHIITQRYPRHRFYMMPHSDYAKAYMGKNNVTVHPQRKLLRGVDKALSKLTPKLSLGNLYSKSMDVSVLIGGSMFQELAGDGSDLKRLSLMPRKDKNLYILGVNYGPAKSESYLRACREYLSSAADVCFRDQTSYELFRELSNTRVGNDLVFGIPTVCPAVEEKENTCVISLIDFSAKPALRAYEEDYLNFLQRQITYQQKLDREVVLVSFCRWEGDENAIEKLLARCSREQKKAIRCLFYDGQNWRQICRCISAAACVVATRFHGMVLGLVYGVPTIPISYSNKTVQLLKDMDRADSAILPEQLASLDPEHLQPVTDIDIAYWQSQGEKHFEKLDALLGGPEHG